MKRREVLGLLASVPLLGAFAEDEAGEPAALVVGIDNYRALRPLNRARADARGISKAVEKLGFGVTLLEDAGLAEFQQTLMDFSARLRRGQPAFIYFAGHGLQIGGLNYLLLRDSHARSVEAVSATCVDLRSMLGAVAARRPSPCVLVLDACRNDPLGSASVDAPPGIAAVKPPDEFYIAYSAGSDQTALDHLGPADRDPNGVFARAFLKNLNGKDSFDRIVKRTRRSVIDLAASVGHRQNPATYDQTADEFTLRAKTARNTRNPVRIANPADAASRFLSVGLRSYCRAGFADLPGAGQDAPYIAEAFRSAGISGTTLVDPSEADLRQAIAALAASSANTLFLYFAGNGFLHDGDGVLLLNVEARTPERLMERGIRLEELTKELQRDGRRLVLFMDTVLGSSPAAVPGRSPGLVGAFHFAAGGVEKEFGPLALYYASDFETFARDEMQGSIHSPFALALQNALARPGLTASEIAAVLDREIRAMTLDAPEQGAGLPPAPLKAIPAAAAFGFTLEPAKQPVALQTPAFWATPSMREAVFTVAAPRRGLRIDRQTEEQEDSLGAETDASAEPSPDPRCSAASGRR